MERRGSERTGTGDGLAVTLVLDVTASEHAVEAGVAGTGLGDDVSILVEVDLALDQGGGGVVADGVEETVGIDNLLLAADGVLDAQVGHQAHGLVLTENLGGHGVEANGDLGVSKQTVGHGLAGTQFLATDQDGDAATVLGQEHGLFGGGVTTTNDVERLVAEDGHSTVADGAGTDTVLPVGLLAGQVQTAGVGTGGDDDGVRGVGGLVVRAVVPLSPQLERLLRQVELGDSLGDHLGSKSDRLLAHLVHQFRATNAVGETGEVLDIGGGGELSTGGGAVGQHTLIQDRLEFRSREVDGSGVSGGAGADDWKLLEPLFFNPFADTDIHTRDTH